MKLVHLQVEGFMGFRGEAALSLNELGLVHITGVNQDDPANNSNGSGKTTLLEALTWGLFGEGLPRSQGNTAQGVRADEVLNDQLSQQCKVVVTLEDRGRRLQVERWRKYKGPSGPRSSGVRMHADGEDALEALDEKETNRLICERLGLDRDIWCRGIIFGQESAFNFCDATAKARTEILTRVMGVEVIDQWLERCRDDKRALKTKLAEAGGKVAMLEQSVARLAASDPSARAQAWEQQRQQRVAQLADELETSKLRGQQLVHHKVMQPPQPAEVPMPPPVDDGPVKAVVRGAQQVAQVLSNHQATLRVLQHKVGAMERMPAVDCPTCYQAVPSAHREQCIAFARKEVYDFENSAELKQAVEANERAKAAVKNAEAMLAEQWQARRAAEHQAVASVRARADWERAMARLDADIASERRQWAQLKQQHDQVLAETNPLEAEVAMHAATLQSQRQQLAELVDEQKRIAFDLDVCQWWEKELPRFRTWLFDAVVDTLAAEANRWLRVMSGGVIWVQISTTKQVGKRLRDELDVQIYRWRTDGTIATRTYRTWSGGEKRRVSLAIDLGLSRLMADRASNPYRFCALDEIDRHLDAQGREGLRRVLDELRAEKDTVLVVTHDAELKASFDQEIVVEKRGGQSTITTGAVDGQGQASQDGEGALV